MRYKRLAIFPAAIAVCGIVSGCFSYHKTVEPTTAPVVETVPAPAPAVSTTTTTTSDNGMVEKQKTTTYTNPGY
jgi:hypothetical protein